LLLTSANAVTYAGDGLPHLPVYAVGEATADAARAAGLTVQAVGDAGVDRLLASIAPDLHLLHLCGEDRRIPVDAPQRITPIAVYRARPIDEPDLGLAEGAVALIHSPRAGERLTQLVSSRGSTSIAAISPAAAEAAGTGWAVVECTAEPNDDALLALAARLCNNPRP
jgi:uroporphyrinogen-III synthase